MYICNIFFFKNPRGQTTLKFRGLAYVNKDEMLRAARFPQVIQVDTTAKTNSSDYYFMLPVGIDSHWKNSVFARIYLLAETTNQFLLIWTIYLELIFGPDALAATRVVMSDGDSQLIASIDFAISEGYVGGIWLKGKISGKNSDGTYNITYDDGERESGVEAELIRRIESGERPGSSDGDAFEEGDEVEARFGTKGITKRKRCYYHKILQTLLKQYGKYRGNPDEPSDGGVGNIALDWVRYIHYNAFTKHEVRTHFAKLVSWIQSRPLNEHTFSIEAQRALIGWVGDIKIGVDEIALAFTNIRGHLMIMATVRSESEHSAVKDPNIINNRCSLETQARSEKNRAASKVVSIQEVRRIGAFSNLN